MYLRWPPKYAIISSTDTNVPAKVPRKSPYLSVSLIAKSIAFLLENTSTFLNKSKSKKQKKQINKS